MKDVLLVLSTSGISDEAINFAVEKAKKDGVGIVALYLLEAGAADEVFDTFSDIGFIGDRPSTQLSESIMKEFRQRGYEELGKVQVKAMEEGVGFEPVMEQGDFVKTILKELDERDISTAILVRRKRRNFFRYFSRSVTDEIKEKAQCEVIVFTEE